MLQGLCHRVKALRFVAGAALASPLCDGLIAAGVGKGDSDDIVEGAGVVSDVRTRLPVLKLRGAEVIAMPTVAVGEVASKGATAGASRHIDNPAAHRPGESDSATA